MSNRIYQVLFCSLSLGLMLAAVVDADTLTLLDGTVVHGEYAGGTLKTIRMQVDGELRNYAIEDVATLDVNSAAFSPRRKAAPPAHNTSSPTTSAPPRQLPRQPASPPGRPRTSGTPVPAQNPSSPSRVSTQDDSVFSPQRFGAPFDQSGQQARPAPQPSPVVPAGTRLLTRLSQDLVAKRDAEGHRFYLELEGALLVGDRVVAERGSNVVAVVTAVSRADFTIRGTDILVNNQIRPIKTDEVVLTGLKSSGSGGGSSMLSGLVGGLAGSTVSSSSGGVGASALGSVGSGRGRGAGPKGYVVPAGTLVELRLTSDLRL